MQILIQTAGGYANAGDLAMLLAAIARLRELWPNASLEVMGDSPQGLATTYLKQEAKPIDVNVSPPQWFGLRNLLRNKVSTKVRKFIVAIEDKFKSDIAYQAKKTNIILPTLKKADALVFCGAGVMNDAFMGHSLKYLEILEVAIQLGKPTALFGQGIGPIKQSYLEKRMKAVLPKVDLIGLREDLNSLPLLIDYGVDIHKIIVTGDDAIEMAYLARAEQLGEHIGINLREASYSEVSSGESPVKQNIRTILRKVASQRDLSLIPIPIDNSDYQAISNLLQEPIQNNLAGPAEIIEAVKRCRVVITGSYHAAVFALSQGISVIGLINSAYYQNKFSGLAAQFGGGCEVLQLDDSQFSGKLEMMLENSLQNAPNNREPLLQQAQLQIQLSRKAYQRFYDFISSRSKASSG